MFEATRVLKVSRDSVSDGQTPNELGETDPFPALTHRDQIRPPDCPGSQPTALQPARGRRHRAQAQGRRLTTCGASGSSPQASQYELPPGPHRKRGYGGAQIRTEPQTQHAHFEGRGSRPPFDFPTLSHSCGHRTSPPRTQGVFPSTTQTQIPRGRHRDQTDETKIPRGRHGEPNLRDTLETDPSEATMTRRAQNRRRSGRRRPGSETTQRARQPDPALGAAHPPWVSSAALPAEKRALRTMLPGGRPLPSRRACGGDWRRHRLDSESLPRSGSRPKSRGARIRQHRLQAK